MNEILLIDKPEKWTSFDVVAKVRSKLRKSYSDKGVKPTKKQAKVGHAGTLDPFATGLLIVLLGDACKSADQYLKLGKSYHFTAKLGEVSSTGDPEGDIEHVSKEVPSREELLSSLKQMTGIIKQTPPIYSAIKIDGKRAYKLAREGKAVEMPSRSVEINSIKLLKYEYPFFEAECEVSSGTYIRTLVGDIGKILKTGAYCSQLRRTRIGEYEVNDARNIDSIEFL